MTDYASITEFPGTLLTPEQWQRFRHRYAFGLRESELERASTRVLEVGCGAGIGLAAWMGESAFVAGLEYERDSLTIAQAALREGTPLLCGDAQYLPLADSSFDMIASFEMIYYLSDPARFIAECRRVLSPGGKFILCWSNPDWSAFAPGRLSGHYPTITEVATWLAEAGIVDACFFGAFASDEISGRGRWVNRLRQVAVRTGIARLLGGVARPLMRAAYGELIPLPERMNPADLQGFVPEVFPLDAQEKDTTHRVIYAVARTPGAQKLNDY